MPVNSYSPRHAGPRQSSTLHIKIRPAESTGMKPPSSRGDWVTGAQQCDKRSPRGSRRTRQTEGTRRRKEWPTLIRPHSDVPKWNCMPWGEPQ